MVAIPAATASAKETSATSDCVFVCDSRRCFSATVGAERKDDLEPLAASPKPMPQPTAIRANPPTATVAISRVSVFFCAASRSRASFASNASRWARERSASVSAFCFAFAASSSSRFFSASRSFWSASPFATRVRSRSIARFAFFTSAGSVPSCEVYWR